MTYLALLLMQELLNDQELIQKFQQNDADSFELLVKKYEKKVYATAMGIVKDPDDALDVTQETFIKVYKYLGKFRGDSSFSTWLFRIVSNTSIDFIRKRNKDRTHTLSLDKPIESDSDEFLLEMKSNDPTPEEVLSGKTKMELIKEAILLLPEEQRVAIVLRDVQGFSYQEIAEMTESNIGTVKSRINRARLTLRDLIKKQGELFL